MKNTFESNEWAECSSCGSSRNRGEQCDYCGKVYIDVIKQQSKGKTFLKSLSSKYQVDRKDGALNISWRWGGMRSLTLLIFFAIWNSLIFSADFGFDGDVDFWSHLWTLFPIPAIHMLVGILGPFYVLTQVINRTTITATSQRLTVKHHPIPWGKKHSFPVNDIEQLFVSKTHRSSKKKSWEVPELQLITKTGARHRLLKGSKGVEFSDYEALRQQLSNTLGIKLVAVHGEASL